jgi:hypothetical protein
LWCLAEYLQLLLPVERNETVLARQFQGGSQDLNISKTPQRLSDKDRKNASLFGGHVNP